MHALYDKRINGLSIVLKLLTKKKVILLYLWIEKTLKLSEINLVFSLKLYWYFWKIVECYFCVKSRINQPSLLQGNHREFKNLEKYRENTGNYYTFIPNL